MPELWRVLADFDVPFKRRRRDALAKLDSLGVTTGLSDPHRWKLATDVVLISHLYEIWTDETKPHEKHLNVWFGRGPGQLRRVRAKVKKLQTAFKDLNDYVNSIGSIAGDRRGNVILLKALEGYGVIRAIAQTGTALTDLRLPPDAEFRLPLWAKRGTENPKDPTIQRLAEFFTAHCGLSKREAHVRIAKIGNTFWDWNVRVREHYEGEDAWKGSDAIRKRLTRGAHRERTTGDTPKRTRR